MRRAELVMAAALGLFSLYLMYLSQVPPLEIGWVRLKGPGSGAFPFWLSLIMFLTCVVIFIRGWRGVTPQSRSDEPFLNPFAFKLFATAALAIFVMLFLTTYVSAYFAIFLFLLFFIRFIGRHAWSTSVAVSALFPVGVFFLFESGMKILLPKGYAEPLFLPLYKLFVY